MYIRTRMRSTRFVLVGAAIAVMLILHVDSSAGSTTTTFTYTGSEQTYSVPPGATGVAITAVGARGGSQTIGGFVAPGFGAAVTATVPLPSGTTTLYVEVGGTGGEVCTADNQNTGLPGGFNGGGDTPGVPAGFGGCPGAGGGGASDVRTTSISSVPNSELTAANDSRLVVAGGGGGAGSGGCTPDGLPFYGIGGTAGDTTVTGPGNGGVDDLTCGAGQNGGNGGFGGSHGGSTGGALGEGGDGVNGSTVCTGCVGGAGGGGGYWGGGGGDPDHGGGAGSSFWVAGATSTSMSEDTTGTPTVEITPVFCTQTGFSRDGIDLTAKHIGGNVTGTLDATGCDIGVYYGPSSTGSVSGATISNAKYFGVVNDRRSNLSVQNSTISNIGNSPFDGTQHGVGILYTTEHALGTPSGTAGGTISGNSLPSYQKGGIVVRGTGASATIQNNTVTGQGMIDYIAQNGIQISYGASALIKGNTVSGNWYTPRSYVACGLLFYAAGGVKQQSNNLFSNEVNLCNAGRGGGNYNP